MVLLACLTLTLSACGGTSSGASTGASASSDPLAQLGTVLDRQVPSDVADAPLIDDAGHRTTFGALRGRPIVLVDTMTECQETCPLTTANLRTTATMLGTTASPEQFVEISVDPGRDDPAHLRAYRKVWGVGADWHFLTGTATSIARIWKFFGVGYDRIPEAQPPSKDWVTGRTLTYDVQHTDVVVLLTPDLHERFVIIGQPNAEAAALPTPMATFLNDQGHSNLAHPETVAWTPARLADAVRWVIAHP
jgi:protein SCO1